jgi:hypothetical protein
MSDSVNHPRTFEVLSAEPVRRRRKPREWSDDKKARILPVALSWMRDPQDRGVHFSSYTASPYIRRAFQPSLRTFVATAKFDDPRLFQCLRISWTASYPNYAFLVSGRPPEPMRSAPTPAIAHALIVEDMQQS